MNAQMAVLLAEMVNVLIWRGASNVNVMMDLFSEDPKEIPALIIMNVH